MWELWLLPFFCSFIKDSSINSIKAQYSLLSKSVKHNSDLSPCWLVHPVEQQPTTTQGKPFLPLRCAVTSYECYFSMFWGTYTLRQNSSHQKFLIFKFQIFFHPALLHSLFLIPCLLSGSVDTKQRADRDETPPRTPTGNAPSSESDIEVSSPSNDLVVSQEEDERLAKELSLKEAAAHDLSHRPKRRRFHESYNFNMKCPTPGCNSLGKSANTAIFLLAQKT